MKEEVLCNNLSSINERVINDKIIKEFIKPRKGTTTLAFIFKEGIIVCVDSRATSGPYIASQTVNKVIEVNKHLLGTMAGGAADCFYWEKLMGNYAKGHELRYSKRITVCAASKFLSDNLYRYSGYGLSVGSMICGYDLNGPAIYYVNDDGLRVKGDLFSVGSGSTIAYGVLSSHYRFDLTLEEALDLGKRAIYHAAHRDAFSGGTVNLYHMNYDGWNKIGSYDVQKLYEEYNK
ncbi:hypothetical protein H312_01437 [Anncaliia algerae PRA339]|uniref:Proteasome subunit beta n=1 Tax=Anncaliia algerae PRA339 TaxID=1288291 RepID=A0A059F1U6_9MICR|nr:hypothetical protein H312_01437 [Anncaliia algerae PRA339]